VRNLLKILDATVGSVERMEGAPIFCNIVRKLHNTLAMHGSTETRRSTCRRRSSGIALGMIMMWSSSKIDCEASIIIESSMGKGWCGEDVECVAFEVPARLRATPKVTRIALHGPRDRPTMTSLSSNTPSCSLLCAFRDPCAEDSITLREAVQMFESKLVHLYLIQISPNE
jgi:hypothetical protein